jgi:phosphoglycerate-specific signal transduction histidine kinase
MYDLMCRGQYIMLVFVGMWKKLRQQISERMSARFCKEKPSFVKENQMIAVKVL